MSIGKKNKIGRSLMNRLQFEEDGKTIGRLQRQIRWLALQLAMAGADPSFPPDNGCGMAKLECIADKWISAAERVSPEQ